MTLPPRRALAIQRMKDTKMALLPVGPLYDEWLAIVTAIRGGDLDLEEASERIIVLADRIDAARAERKK